MSVHSRRPPLVEVVLGVQFQPLEQMSMDHLAHFWKAHGEEGSHFDLAPALEQQFELFGSQQPWGLAGPRLRLTLQPQMRVQLRNAAGTRMIQAQNGRFHYNWLRGPGEEYPRFRMIRPEFERQFATFLAFIRAQSLGQLLLNQWEVTYVNHIPKGALWQTAEEWPRLLPGLIPGGNIPTLSLESASAQWHYVIKTEVGRLHIEIGHGRGPRTGATELLVLKLTARGPLASADDMLHGLDLGRRAAGQAFFSLTSDEAHREWEMSLEHD